VATTAPNPSLVAARPAESLTIVGAIAFLIARALGVDNDTTMTALTMVIAFTPAAITWLVELFARGKAQTPEAPHDAVADELKDLNKAVREAVASKPTPEPKESAIDAADLVDAVRLVLVAQAAKEREGKGKAQTPETPHDAVADELKDLNKAVREAVASRRPPEPKESAIDAADLLQVLGDEVRRLVVQMFAEARKGTTRTPRSGSRPT
jgi:hypothetical protein